VVLTMFDERTNLAQQVAGELRNFFGDKLFAATIPRNVRLAEAPSHGKPALLYDVRSKGAESYIRLAKEVMDREQRRAEQSSESAPTPAPEQHQESDRTPAPADVQPPRVIELEVETAEPAGVSSERKSSE